MPHEPAQRSGPTVAALISPLDALAADELRAATRAVERALSPPGGPAPAPREPITLRKHRVGAVGGLVYRQAVPCAHAEGWAAGVEVVLAEIGARWLRRFDPAGQWAALVAVGPSSAGAYWVWLWALEHTAPTKATTFLALSPLTAALSGAAALGESLGWGFALGLACILLGLVVTGTRRTVPIAA